MSEYPNVLVIMTDDQPPHARMERVIARMDRDWTETGYSDIPLCGPARVSLFTGQYPHAHGVTSNPTSYNIYNSRGYFQNDVFSRVKRSEAGYKIGMIGKFINGYGDAGNDRWEHPHVDRWVALASGQGGGDYEVNTDGTIRDGLTQNQTVYFGEKVESFIRNNADGERPWFCYFAPTDPHGPYTALDRYRHTHDGERYVSPGTEEEDISDKSVWTQTRDRSEGSAMLQGRWEGVQEELEGLEEYIIRLLDALVETGQGQNTIVILTSDNGYLFGEHGGMSKKGYPYEEVVRVPFYVSMPGSDLPESLLVSRQDVTATVLDITGADMSGTDGRSFYGSDVINAGGTSNATGWRGRVLVEGPFLDWAMLREGDLAYMSFPGGEEEMYDMAEDPFQTESLNKMVYSTEYGKMRDMCASMRGAGGDQLRALEEV